MSFKGNQYDGFVFAWKIRYPVFLWEEEKKREGIIYLNPLQRIQRDIFHLLNFLLLHLWRIYGKFLSFIFVFNKPRRKEVFREDGNKEHRI